MRHKLKLFGVITIDAAGTAERLTTEEIYSPAVYIQADSGNTGMLYVGESDVDETNGIELSPEDAVTLDGGAFQYTHGTQFLLSDIYLDAETSGNKARVYYLVPR
jgi:hypothetical protein